MIRFLSIIFILSLHLQAESPFSEYLNNSELDNEIKNLKHPFLNKQILAKTSSGHPIHLITLSDSEDPRPAILIIGDTASNSPVGCEIIISWLKSLVKDETKLARMVKKNTFYIIPRPAPEALDQIFGETVTSRTSNSRMNDEDKDHKSDEDPFEDLNGDGFITLMRIKKDNADYEPHPEMPYVMVKTAKGKGSYTIYSEGIDNDKDEQFNEDPPGGVVFNNNFTFNYPYFEKGAGPHQISEPETKAVADFAFAHPEIFLVLSFGPEDNMVNPWKEDPKKRKIRNRVTVFKDDEKWLNNYAADYKKIFEPQGKPQKVETKGSFAKWAYFHLGKMSISINPWWIPVDQKLNIKDKRNIDEVKRALWLQKNRPEAFVNWTKIKHPDFKESVVEVGGIKPGYNFIPDMKTCKDKSLKFTSFIDKILQDQPKISIKDASFTKMGNSVYRLEFTIYNEGSLPTAPLIGQHIGKSYPLNISISAPDKWSFYKGYSRSQTGHLKPGESKTLQWLIISHDDSSPQVGVSILCPHLQEINFKAGLKK